MAGLTKDQRAERETAEKERLRKEIEEQVRSEIASSINISNDDTLKQENEELKIQIAEMMDKIKDLEARKSEPKNATVENRVSDKSDNIVSDKSDNIEDVEMNARILVTSITTGGVNLKTSNDGSARHFRFEKLGQTIPIIYEHLINCINTDRWLFEDGLIYISDPNVIREQYLEDAYKKFLTPDTIANILDFDMNVIMEMITSTTPAIQETIIDIVANKLNHGSSIDMNKVNAIGTACNVNIMELASRLK